MDRITKIIQETHHRFLNLFCMDGRLRNGEASDYYVGVFSVCMVNKKTRWCW